jgi:hypothetical protein
LTTCTKGSRDRFPPYCVANVTDVSWGLCASMCYPVWRKMTTWPVGTSPSTPWYITSVKWLGYFSKWLP